ncbi:MAG: hypothetical protein IKX86_00375 [Clostridia bacterium]|nr:hypothetical protein [Clostridia bacterium]
MKTKMKKIDVPRTLFAAILAAVLLLASCAPKYGRIMTYEGHYITEDKYYYWTSSYKRNILYSYSDAYDTASFWQSDAPDGKTVEEYFTLSIDDRIKDYLIAEVLFREMKLTLSSSVKASIEDNINEKLDYYGGRSGLNNELKNIMLTVSTLREVYTAEKKLEAVQNALFGEGGEYEITEEDVVNYYNSRYSHIKYIVFYTERVMKDGDGNILYDDEGLPLTEEMTAEEKKDRLAKIEKCIAELSDGADFDELREKYSEYDTSEYPNGFLISENEVLTWGSDIVNAVVGSSVGDIVKVDEEHATYVIEKFPLEDINKLEETDMNQISSIATYVMSDRYNEIFSPLREKVTVDGSLKEKYRLSEIKPNPYYAF